jgi:hypothetical protein
VLRQTTEVLAAELASPSATTPSWSQTEWRIARGAVTIHGIAGLLAHGSRWQGPAWWPLFLQSQRAQIAARLQQMEALQRTIDERARASGITLVALKGAALHARGLYAPGARPMADLDLLVSPTLRARAESLLKELGFVPTLETPKHLSFEDPKREPLLHSFGEDATRPIKIELHTRVQEQLPLTCVDITALVQPPSTAPAGLRDYAAEHGLLAHLLLHAAGSLLWRSARLVQLHDIHKLSAALTEAHWDHLLESGAAAGGVSPWWMYPPLQLVNRYYGCVPRRVLEHLARQCRWWLRWAYRERSISDVSISNLWVSAFPGIEWGGSVREIVSYAAQRFWPSAEILALRKTLADSQPLVSGGEWAQMSQSRRMLRWLFARQPRQESMQTIRAALEPDLSFTR